MSAQPGPWNNIKHDSYLFRWRWSSAEHRGAINWEVHEIAGEMDGKTVYADIRHHSNSEDFIEPKVEPIEGGHVLSGFTRFDGCSNIQQTRSNCMMHFCDTTSLVEISQDIHGLGRVFLEETGSGWE